MKEGTQQEYVDLVNTEGEIEKTHILRSEVDTYPQLHLQIVIAVLTNQDGNFLVHKRSQTKSVNPGDIDHVCGGVMSGETPEAAAARESIEETGLNPNNVKVVNEGLNSYNRYRYLLSGNVEGEPSVDQNEAEWVKFISMSELEKGRDTGEFTFVDEFFEDLENVSNKK